MKLVLIRHGEADYTEVISKGHLGMGIDMAHLSERGIEQAHSILNDERLNGAEVIISSPYTRDMQTAAIISKKTGLDIIVENDLHEWIPDLTYKRRILNHKQIGKEIDERNGIWDESCKNKWESYDKLGERAFNCLKKYLGKYDKIIVVAHGYVFNQFIFNPVLKNCEIQEYELTKDSKPLGFAFPKGYK